MKCEKCELDIDEDALICVHCAEPTKEFMNRYGFMSKDQQIMVFRDESEAEIMIRDGKLNRVDKDTYLKTLREKRSGDEAKTFCHDCGEEIDKNALVCAHCTVHTDEFLNRYGFMSDDEQMNEYRKEADMEIKILKGELDPKERDVYRAWLRESELKEAKEKARNDTLDEVEVIEKEMEKKREVALDVALNQVVNDGWDAGRNEVMSEVRNERRRKPKKKVWLATILAFIFCGAGQFYNGEYRKAGIFAGTTIFSVITMSLLGEGGLSFIINILMAFVYLFGIIDAIISARRINESQRIRKPNRD